MSSSSSRDRHIDSVKGGLISLVVLGHFLEAADAWAAPSLSPLLSAIYVFHMPAFAVLAGAVFRKDRMLKKVLFILVILVAFQTIYSLILFRGAAVETLTRPIWILWFLLSLVFWMAVQPLLDQLPVPTLVCFGLALVAAAVPFDGYILSWSRTWTFLPFFTIGHRHGSFVLRTAVAMPRWACVIALVSPCVVVGVAAVPSGWLYGSLTYDQLQVTFWQGAATRTCLFAAAATAALGFAGLLSSANEVLCKFGENSLSILVARTFCSSVRKRLFDSRQ